MASARHPRGRARRLGIFATTALALPGVGAEAQCAVRELAAEAFTGSAWSLPVPLTIALPEGTSRITARYGTRPFADAPYYSYRLGYARADGRGVEAEMLHHKLYLENPKPPVERFEVTHGYNLPMVNGVVPAGGWRLRVGVGMVVAHPEGRIAGRAIGGARTLLGGGYHIAGVTAQVAVGRRYALGSGRLALTAAPEAKVTASWARVTVAGVRVTVPNVALHLLGGVGVRRCG
jgi:hypothetical protein